MTPAYLSGLAGFLLAVVFRYAPKLSTEFEKLSTTVKQLIMLVLVVLSAFLVWLIGCESTLHLPFITAVECSSSGINVLIENTILAIVGNQGGAGILPKLPKAQAIAKQQAVEEAKPNTPSQ